MNGVSITLPPNQSPPRIHAKFRKSLYTIPSSCHKAIVPRDGVAPSWCRGDSRGLADGAIAVNEASIKATSPIPRVGEAGELKGVAVFLAADASNYITGQTIVVDGGRTIA